jgi:hypothetical protein
MEVPYNAMLLYPPSLFLFLPANFCNPCFSVGPLHIKSRFSGLFSGTPFVYDVENFHSGIQNLTENIKGARKCIHKGPHNDVKNAFNTENAFWEVKTVKKIHLFVK